MWRAHQRALTRPAGNVAVANGKLLNFNTIEEFKASDKKALFAEVADEVRAISIRLSRITHVCIYRYGLRLIQKIQTLRVSSWLPLPISRSTSSTTGLLSQGSSPRMPGRSTRKDFQALRKPLGLMRCAYLLPDPCVSEWRPFSFK